MVSAALHKRPSQDRQNRSVPITSQLFLQADQGRQVQDAHVGSFPKVHVLRRIASKSGSGSRIAQPQDRRNVPLQDEQPLSGGQGEHPPDQRNVHAILS